MPKHYDPLDPKAVKTYPLASRPSKVRLQDGARPWRAGGSFQAYLDSLPNQLAARSLREIVRHILAARSRGKPVILAMGAHVIKVGLSPIVVDLLERGLLGAVALNGAGVVHDFELAVAGFTSEDVEAQLAGGEFGMAEETGRFLNQAVAEGTRRGLGFGRAVGESLLALRPPHLAQSIPAACARLDLPCTVHVALGTDIIHMHPSCDGARVGEATQRDFHLLAAVVADLEGGGVYLNVGSAVLLPEVFLKALTLARNLGHRVQEFVTVNLDFIQHYRPTQNVVRRPVAQGGKGYALTGHHELLLPLLAAALIEGIESREARGESGGPEAQASTQVASGMAALVRAAKKVKALPAVVRAVRKAQALGRRVVFTNGCFDLLHRGHIRYLEQARALGDLLVVAINSDASVRRLKGPGRPVVPGEARAEVLGALAAVDLVVIFGEPDPARVIRAIQPDVLVKGGDWPVERIVGADVVRARGGVVRSLPYLEGASTTGLIRRMAKTGRRKA